MPLSNGKNARICVYRHLKRIINSILALGIAPRQYPATFSLIAKCFLQVCTERGWREYASENNVFKDRWNLWWRSGGFPTSHYRPLLPWQVTMQSVYVVFLKSLIIPFIQFPFNYSRLFNLAKLNK